jgi:CheY-like chemotaxis protein
VELVMQGSPTGRPLLAREKSAAKQQVLLVNPKIVQKFLEPLIKTVLVVDDDDDTRLLTKAFLNSFGYEVDSTNSASDALVRFNPNVHDVVLTDNSMQGMTGVEMAHIIKLRSPSTPVVMYTGRPPDNHHSIDIVLKKPTYPLAIKDAIEKLLAPK